MTVHLAPSSTRPLMAASPAALGRLGTLEVRLARDEQEKRAAQSVRYRVFFEEMGARKRAIHALEQRDADRFDPFCDHVVVLDYALPGPDHARIVGTYRLLPQDRAARIGGFYSESEFTLAALSGRHAGKRFLELGRSCVLPQWRSKRTIELLWQGIWAYVLETGADVLVGCGSFPGTIPAAHAMALSWLHHHHRANGDWRADALPARFSTMDLMPAEALDARAALAGMPALIKAYLRVGALFGEGCVVDSDFGTTDVFVILPVERIAGRYVRHYGAQAERFAA